MKAPQFWNANNQSLWPKILTPLSYIWTKETQRRLNQKGYISHLPVICIGNITIGGSGKTQAAIKLAQFYQKNGYKPAFLSRGYGANVKEATKVDNFKHSYKDVGDEPLLLSQLCEAWVSPNRRNGARAIEKNGTADIIIMDDGMQNQSLHKDFNLLIIDGIFGLGNQKVIPSGPLREPLGKNLDRINYGLIIGEDKHNIRSQLSIDFLQATIESQENSLDKTQKYWAFCGLGRPSKFYETLHSEGFNVTSTTNFADHHPYTEKEIKDLLQVAKLNNCKLITTEKDKIRIPKFFQNEIDYLSVSLKVNFEKLKHKLPLLARGLIKK